jgi:hypothetical protein
MDARDFVQLCLLAMDGGFQGKTKLQKTVYFLALMTDCLDGLGYRPHYYGPYSEDVTEAIDWLRVIGAVDQSSAGAGMVDRAGFEIRRVDYRLNDQGKRFVAAAKNRHPERWDRLHRAAGVLKGAGDLDYVSMSIAAKTYFLLQENPGPASREELARIAARFGWDVTPQQIEQAASYLERLGIAPVA